MILLYFVARFVATIGDAWCPHPCAAGAAIGNGYDGPCIKGSHHGRAVRVSFTTGQSVGSGESATAINAFYIEVVDLAGRQDWRIKFYVSGLLGQGAKQLHIEVQDKTLGERLERSGVLDAVSAVSAPTQDYVTVAYEARRQILLHR